MRKKTQPVKQRVRIPSFHLIDSGKHPSLQPNASKLVKLFTKLLVSTLYLYQVQPQLGFYQQQLNHPRAPLSFCPFSADNADKTLTEPGPLTSARPSKPKSKIALGRKKTSSPTGPSNNDLCSRGV